MTTQPRLIAFGVVLVLLGIFGLGMTVASLSADVPAAAGEAIRAEPLQPQYLVVLWPLMAGLGLAAGAALIGLGMNRWKGRGQPVQ
jgi:hypothetical protein